MLHTIFALFFVIFLNIKIEPHTQAYFDHKKQIPQQELPEINITNTAHTPTPNIQNLIPNKTVFEQPPKPDHKPLIFVTNPNTGKIEPLIFVADDQEELKERLIEKYGPITEKEYLTISASMVPVILIPVAAGGTVISIPVQIAVGGGILIGWGIKEIIHAIKGKKDKQKNNNDENSGDGNGNNSEDPDDKNPKNKQDPKQKSVEDILKDTTPGRETKGKAKQYIKKGNYEDAVKDFESLRPTDVKDIPGKEGKTGILPDGRKVNVRVDSTYKTPTLEIQPAEGNSGKFIKIRYE